MSEEVEDKKESQYLTKAKANSIYFGMVMSIFFAVGIPTLEHKYPEIFQSKEEEKLTENKFDKLALKYPESIAKRYSIDSAIVYEKIERLRGNLSFLKDENHRLKEQVKSYTEIVEGLQKQINFNTHQIGINGEAVFLLMEKPNTCTSINYKYAKEKANKYIMFKDWYNCTTLQPVMAQNPCKVYVVPFDRNRIKL